MASFIRDYIDVFGARVITLCLGIGMQICLAWLLGPGGRGSYAVCLMFAMLLSLIFMIGCDVASVYFVSAGRFTISEGITYTLIYSGIGSFLAVFFGLLLMQLPLTLFEKASSTSLYLALLTIPFSVLSLILMRLLTAIRQFGWFAVMSVMSASVQLLLTVIFLWKFSWGVNGAIMAMLIKDIAIVAVTLAFFRLRCLATIVKPSLKCLRDMFHYGSRYYVGRVSNQLNFELGTMILAFFATKEEIGLFAVASQIVSRFVIIPEAFSQILMPRIATDKEGRKKLVARCARSVALICGILLSILAVFAEPIVKLLFSPSFGYAALLIQVMAFGFLVRCACRLFEPYFLGIGHPGVISISVAIGIAVNLLLMLVLLPTIGLKGAAISVTVGYLVSSFLLTANFVDFSGMKLKDIWLVRPSDWEPVIKLFKKTFCEKGINRFI